MKTIPKILTVLITICVLYFAGTWGEEQKKEEAYRQAIIEGCAADWFGWMAQDKAKEALDLCGFPFDANGTERVATREQLENIFPRYFSLEKGAWPWTRPSPFLMAKFWRKPLDPEGTEEKKLAKGVQVIQVWMDGRENKVRVYVRPDPTPKVVGFKISGLDKFP